MEWRRKINRRVPIAHTLYVIMEICKGLSYAHELPNPETGKQLGIVHRDISPPNVLISKQGEIKVVDFGLAKATSQIETTDPGVVKGKMSYLSPEAARGEEVDSAADIFAVGILLYEMLTGKRLFYGETDYQTVELVRNAKIPPIKPQNPQVEPELEDIVRKALAKRKEDRYQSALDLQDALAQYSYSRGLKVISRDIAELVRQCLDDRASASSDGKKPSIIDHMLQEEIVKITSVDFEDPGARPLSADDVSPNAGDERPSVLDDGDFIDPRAWSEERFTPALGIKQVDEIERRTARDPVPVQLPPPTIKAQAAEARKTGRSIPTLPPPTGSAAIKDEALGSGGPTPGPESLASVLEPSQVTIARRPERKAARSFFIGAAIGVVLLGGVVAALVMKKSAGPQTPQTHSSATP